ncbi:MAG TPA: T9SS type A sorting domain-containing protein [Ignavibacteria bacterium]|nr:T9SS type A sorting domain-containing protein [Ignavibacteria bacterium]
MDTKNYMLVILTSIMLIANDLFSADLSLEKISFLYKKLYTDQICFFNKIVFNSGDNSNFNINDLTSDSAARRINKSAPVINKINNHTGSSGLILSNVPLNSNNISAWYLNNGRFNWKENTIGLGFQWPKPENKFARYTSGHIFGAIVNGDTLVAVIEYGSEYLPGYTDENGNPHGNGLPEFRTYKLTHGVNDSDRSMWPNILLGNSDQNAPVYFDKKTMSWQPDDFANQTMFYCYTDSYEGSHNYYSGSTQPLKIDIKQTNFSFNQPEELKNVIYQEYKIINRSNNIWSNAYFNIYTDDDIGEAGNDGAATDTNLRLTYTYNYTSSDFSYGNNPPAVGFLVIRAPLKYTGNSSDSVYYYHGKNKTVKRGYTEMKFNSSVIYHDDSFQPRNYREEYNAIRGLKNNGTPYINPVTNEVTKFVFSGDPGTGSGWIQSGSGDMRFYNGFGPMTVNPGDTQIIVLAQVIDKGVNNLNSITKLRELSVNAKKYYDKCFEDVVISVYNGSSAVPEDFILYQNYPNPFNSSTVIKYVLKKQGHITVKVYDITGKEISTLVNENQKNGTYSVTFSPNENGNQLQSGVLFYTLSVNSVPISTKKLLYVK